MLIDESGFLLNPVGRRTWARQGHTPVLPSWGRHRDKVSVIAALSVAPQNRRLSLFFRTDAKRYIDAEAVAGFLRTLLRHRREQVIVVWGGGTNHKGPLVRMVGADFPRLHLERLPAYAPDLNPVEFIWSYLKYGQMANFIPGMSSTLTKLCKATCTRSRTHRVCSNNSGEAPNFPSLYFVLLD